MTMKPLNKVKGKNFKMKRRNLKTKYVLIGIAVIIMVILAIFSYTLEEERQPTKFESLIKDTIIGFENIVTYPFKFIFKKINNYQELHDIRAKYEALLNNVERIDSLTTENIELREQLETLKEELEIDYTINDYSFLNATVITRNTATWYNTITIDKGTYNGVKVGMAVVNSKGLIGKIISTTTFTSEVKLLSTSDTNNKISVSIHHNNKKIYGLIKNYNYNKNYLEIEGISNTEQISISDYVYTSGLGGVFPSGILIGKVTNITTDEYDLSKIIQVEPIVNFNNINYVAILKRKETTK